MMSQTPGSPRCALHDQRVAAARCMSCESYFCHECITEHDLRMLCAPCLRKEMAGTSERRSRGWFIAIVAPAVQLLVGVVLLWLTLYFAGRLLIATPTNFHEGTIWEGGPQ